MKMKKQNGFTIIELVIISAVIVILAALVLKTYASIQVRYRNTTRQNNLKTLQQTIESFYSNNGYFPNLTDLNSPSWRTKNMPSLDASDLVDPLSQCNPATTACLGGKDGPVKKQYEYYATQSDGAPCNGTLGSKADQTCAQYKLFAKFEGVYNGQRYYELQNLD
jgi:Tfp pilus assembly protein PilE